MTDTFNWKHLPGAQAKIAMRTRKVQFGDGYSQTLRDGINNVTETWPLTFEGNWTEIQPIYDFLKSHGGDTSFYWTSPVGPKLLWKVESFNLTSLGGNIYSLTAEFVQSFNP
jgi:phage-related protein